MRSTWSRTIHSHQPSILEAAGLPEPRILQGVEQVPIQRTSLWCTPWTTPMRPKGVSQWVSPLYVGLDSARRYRRRFHQVVKCLQHSRPLRCECTHRPDGQILVPGPLEAFSREGVHVQRAASPARGDVAPRTTYWFGRDSSRTVGSNPAASNSSITWSGVSRMSAGGPRSDSIV